MLTFSEVCVPKASPSDIYIVGGGPSLIGFDFSRLRSHVVLAVNDAALRFPWATYGFSLDVKWVANRVKTINQFEGTFYIGVPEDYQPLEEVTNAKYLKRCRINPGLSYSKDTIAMGGGNSGFGATNLAFLLGYKRLILLGFDFKKTLESSHWHGGYAWTGSARDLVWQRWAKALDLCSPLFRKAGVEVVDASIGGRLTAYPKVELSELPLWPGPTTQI